MAEFSFPHNGTTVGDATAAPYDAETEWANYWRSIIGVAANRNDAGVIIGSGSESAQLEGLQVTQNGAGAANVLVNIGAALVHGTGYTNSTAITQSIAANASGNPRIDTIVLRKSWAAQTVRQAILQGTPAATPAAPTLTQTDGVTWEIPIADIAVANGFVSILNASITPRALFTSAADGVYLDRLLNNSANAMVNGQTVTIETAADRAVDDTSAPATSRPPIFGLGTWQARVAAAGIGRALHVGIGNINVDAAYARGIYASLRNSGLTSKGFTYPQFDTIAYLLAAAGAAGNVQALIHAGFPQQFGQIGDTSLLAAPAASISVGGGATGPDLGYRTMLIEYFLRSAVVATNDNISIRFASDSTAANYRSYRLGASGTAPTMAAAENIGATAGIQLNIPGSTATAGAYAYGIIFVSNVNLQTVQRHWIGINFYRITDLTGGFAVNLFGGLWNNAGQALNAVSAVSNGGSNFAIDSYLNLFTKQV